MSKEKLTADRLAKVYIKIREKRREIAKQDEELKEQLDLVAQKLLDICKEQGATTIRTDHGTVSRRITKNYWTSDWDSFFRFVKDNDAFALVQHRINNVNMSQFLEENPNMVPPGLNSEVNQTISILKR